MAWYWIVLLTLTVYWAVGMVISQIKYEWLESWAVGLLFPVLYVLFYPIREINTYRKNRSYYRRHNITFLQHFFGKRVRQKEEE